jgi:phage-related protein
MSDAVVRGMTNVRVVMDGETVGNLVAPYVSQRIARDSA